ncbi:MAG: recombinase family protein, partial [Planctomycetota bacterium]
CIAGMGVEAICKKLVKDGVEPMNNHKWNRTYIRNLLRSKTVIGEYQPTTRNTTDEDGEPIKLKSKIPAGKPIKGYYKAIITEATFFKAQEALDSRVRHRGPVSKFVNVLSGLVYDKASDSTMYLATKPQKDGSKIKSLYPSAAVNGTAKYWSVPLLFVEVAVLRSIKEVTLDSEQTEEEEELEGLLAKASSTQQNISTLQTKLAKSKGEAFGSGLDLLQSLESDLRATEADVERVQATLSQKPQDRLNGAQAAIEALDRDNSDESRLALRGQLRTLIDKIVIEKGPVLGSKHGLTIAITYQSEPIDRLVLVDLEKGLYLNLRHDIGEDAEDGEAAVAIEDFKRLA